ncbi:hypothetical protein LOTGIDRAFT_115283 [Lottia gigantea]|uniref:G-protein coupled receptors family 1 profile domain-containing protein n=1 Tax=Lottia gigantea TaxID=225164 RepID=V4AIT8_LOTGI|nr:hypothetical protein LOTGIDRAFT_115283 [Lottia gigantea]ESO96932.1 hypothetical protein LOTGIDRAFT_115283 [Lottia gigantea]
MDKALETTTEYIIIVCFTIMITFGAAGNGLVCYVVARNSQMRTPRNIFIINLAISDFTLCLFTQPLNLYKLLQYHWTLGSFMCKFATMFQGTNVFVSTISITAIALDRFQVIVYPTKDSMKRAGAAIALITIWLISFLMASPFLLFSILKEDQPLPAFDFYIYICIEDVKLATEKRAYSVAQIVVQYVLPIVIVIVAHLRICNKLKYRMVHQQNPGSRSPYQRKKNERNRNRKRKTNFLLIGIAVVFALSWLPLNIFNLLSEFNLDVFRADLQGREQSININLAYAICHMLVLASACLNPVLYGWLNDNFRTEFMKVLCCQCCKDFQSWIKMKLCCHTPDVAAPALNVPAITITANNGSGGHIEEDGFTVAPSIVCDDVSRYDNEEVVPLKNGSNLSSGVNNYSKNTEPNMLSP